MITIVVSSGPFAAIHEAAAAESWVDWSVDADPAGRACTECHAAIELSRHLARLLPERPSPETVLALCEPEDWRFDAKEDGVAILLGDPASNPGIRTVEERSGRSLSADASCGSEGFRITSLRHGRATVVVLSGHGRVGTLYAAYAFLEALGVRWYAPGENGTHVPRLDRLQIPFLDLGEAPAFTTRGCYSEYIDDSDDELLAWMSRNRMNFAHFQAIRRPQLLKKLGIRICGGGHEILYRFIPPDGPCKERGAEGRANAEVHPEWYCLIDGERRFRRDPLRAREGFFTGDNFCTTNPGAVAALCDGIVGELASGQWRCLDYLNFWLLDNGAWCECESCTKAGNLASRMILLVHAVRRRILTAVEDGTLGRDVKVMFPAYHETLVAPDRDPPEGFDDGGCFATFFPIERCYQHAFDDPRCTETNAGLLRDWRSWATEPSRRWRGGLFVGEYYNVSDFASMPLPLSAIVSHDIPFYHATGARHFYAMHMTSGGWGPNALRNTLCAKLLWNPRTDVAELRARYFRDRYGTAAEEMAECYARLEAAMDNIKYLKHYQGKGAVRHSIYREVAENGADFFRLAHLRMDRRLCDSNAGISLEESVALLRECRRLLDAAREEARDEGAAKRIDEDARSIAYGEDHVLFIYHMLKARIAQDRGDFREARSQLAELSLRAESLEKTTWPFQYTPYCSDFRNGLDATNMKAAYARLARELGAQLVAETSAAG